MDKSFLNKNPEPKKKFEQVIASGLYKSEDELMEEALKKLLLNNDFDLVKKIQLRRTEH